MQAIDCDVASLELLGEIDREKDLRELALAIGAHASVAASEHHVGKVDWLLSCRRDVDDARRFVAREHGYQQTRQQEACEIIDREAQFEAVGAELALPPLVPMPALLTSTSRPSASRRTASARERTSASEERSAARKRAAPPCCVICSTTASPRVRSRPWAMTRQPYAARRSATLRPTPSVEPVMRTVLRSVVMILCSAIEYEVARAGFKALVAEERDSERPSCRRASSDRGNRHHAAGRPAYRWRDPNRSRYGLQPTATMPRR